MECLISLGWRRKACATMCRPSGAHVVPADLSFMPTDGTPQLSENPAPSPT